MAEQMQPLSGAAGGQSGVEAGPLMQLHLAPSRMLWRIGPAWAVVAGAVAAGVALGDAVSLLRLAAAVILADLIWGILRRIIPDSPGIEGTASLADAVSALRTQRCAAGALHADDSRGPAALRQPRG